MITRLNFVDRSAGCVAIVAVRETAERFGMGKDEEVWFLKNRKYVDDAMGGAHDKNCALRISQDLEDIIENGGLCFKETVMIGDPLGETGELPQLS